MVIEAEVNLLLVACALADYVAIVVDDVQGGEGGGDRAFRAVLFERDLKVLAL